jgi:hypothetical protein
MNTTMTDQTNAVQAGGRKKIALETVQSNPDGPTALGLFICRLMQAFLGAEFILALIASLRWTHTISSFAMLVDVVFLLAAGIVCYLVVAGKIDLGVSSLAQRNFFPVLIGLGVILRLAWVLIMSPVQLSDAKDYTDLAHSLVNTGSYVDFETGHRLLAFRAPGYPAFLALSMKILGDHVWTPAAGNLVLFIATAVVLGLAAKGLGGRRSAFITLLLFVLWPSDIFLTGLAISEPLSLFLLTVALWLFSLSDEYGAKASIAAGVVGGALALTRPTLLLFPALWAIFALVGPNFWSRTRQIVIASVMMVATLTPWIVRNYRLLHAFVPVSTNGGDVFYRANNDLATGSWTPAAERDLDSLQQESEVKWNAESYRLGKVWIRNHPLKFAKLAVRKAVYLTQEDETGIYWSMARGHQDVGPTYKALEVLSDAWWQLLCLLGLVAIWRRGLLPNAYAALFASGFGLLVVVHLVYESQPRYRMPAVGLLIVVIAASLCRSSKADALPAGHTDSLRS